MREAQLDANRVLRQLGLKPQVEEGEGYYMWVKLPEGVDDIELTRRAGRESIFLAPGSVFQIDGSRDEGCFLRLNIAYIGDTRFREFLRREISSSRP